MTSDELRERIRELEERLAESEAARERMQRGMCGCGVEDPGEALKLARIIVENSPVILFRRLVADPPRLVYLSENIARWGYKAADFLSGKTSFADIVHPEDMERIRAEIGEHGRRDAEEYGQEYRILTKSGEPRWVHDKTSAVRDGEGRIVFRQGVLLDITERKLAEERLRRSEEKFRRVLETAGEGFVLMDDDLFIREVNDAYCGMLGLRREDILGKSSLDLSTEAFRRFLEANKERFKGMEYRRFEGELRARDGRAVPVLINGNTLRDAEGKRLGHVAFVTDLTEQKKALLLAEEVQKSLLPQSAPLTAGLEIAGRSVACDEIGGDYFDYFESVGGREGVLGAVVGDISGHGVDAALLMAMVRGFMRMRASRSGSLSEIVSDMNRYLVRDLEGSGRFMTMFSLVIDKATGALSWVRAGHDPAFIYAPQSGEFLELMGRGMPLGVLADVEYEELSAEGLPPGGVLALGTDGIWEAMDASGTMFGKERFKEIIRANAERSASEILDAVYDEVERYIGGNRVGDDITLVVIKRVCREDEECS